MPTPADNLRGALLMSASMAGFVMNDAVMKSVLGDLGLAQAVCLRGLFATTLIAALAYARGALQFGAVRGRDGAIILVRSIAEISATLCFLTALKHLPFANVSAILQLTPLTITFVAALFLAEPVGWRRGVAILTGFLGVMLIVRPGADSFDQHAYWALGTVAFATLRDLSTRLLDARTPSLLVSLAASCTVTFVSGGLSLLEPWREASPMTLAVLAGAAVMLFIGYLGGVMAMRVGEISLVSPFRYTSLLWAVVVGVVLFNEIPDAWTLAGAAIIVVAGVYTFHRERQRARLRPAAVASTTPRGP